MTFAGIRKLEKRLASFVLMEVLLALTLFGLVAVALTNALNQVGKLAIEGQFELHVINGLQSALLEASKIPELEPGIFTSDPDSLGIVYETTIVEMEQLRAAARRASASAVEARSLAASIARRRTMIVSRDDGARARHTTEVWRSRAAARSRAELVDGVGFTLWTVAQDLLDIQRALDRRAEELDDEAARLGRRADELPYLSEPVPPFLFRPGVVDGWAVYDARLPTSNPVPRGNR